MMDSRYLSAFARHQHTLALQCYTHGICKWPTVGLPVVSMVTIILRVIDEEPILQQTVCYDL